jgi:hypothetical protein
MMFPHTFSPSGFDIPSTASKRRSAGSDGVGTRLINVVPTNENKHSDATSDSACSAGVKSLTKRPRSEESDLSQTRTSSDHIGF